jgi:hypothetical protein
MEQLTFGACVKKSWSSTWQAIVQMPGLLLGAGVVFACITLLSGSFQHTAAESAQLDAATRASHALIRMALSILQFVVSGCLTIKIHRFVLLGEGSQPLVPLGGKPLARYILFSFCQALLAVLFALAVVLLVVLVRHHKGFGIGFMAVTSVLFFVYGFVALRLSLLFPAIALGARLKLRAAWNDSRGHFWSMWAVSVVAALPVLVLFVPFLILTVRHTMAANSQVSSGLAIGLALVNALVAVLVVVLIAAAVSWLYRRYASQLRDEVAQ